MWVFWDLVREGEQSQIEDAVTARSIFSIEIVCLRQCRTSMNVQSRRTSGVPWWCGRLHRALNPAEINAARDEKGKGSTHRKA